MTLPTSLPALVQALRTDQVPLADYLAHLEAQFASREAEVLAFVPEENRFERLRREAAELAERFPNPATRPALYGVPVGVKDIFHVEGFPTRAGSRLPAEELQGAEAESVTRLKEAGALILGKTVTTEFAYFAPGPTRNPRNPAHTPGGSSSGSAAAVAAGLAPLALGTQTIGSIVRPASFCGIVGFKPSYERVSRAGVIPLAPSLDHVGVFAGTIAGAALTASVLIPDWRKEITHPLKPVLAMPEGPYLEHASEEMLAHFKETVRRLREADYLVKPVHVMADFSALCERHHLITAGEAARAHAAWFPKHRDLYHPKTIELLERGLNVSDEALAEALPSREQLRAELMRVMNEQRIDIWISPSAVGPAPAGLESTGDPVMNLPWTHAGLPVLNLPSGQDAAGLPLGLQLAGRWRGDEHLLAWAVEIERLINTA